MIDLIDKAKEALNYLNGFQEHITASYPNLARDFYEAKTKKQGWGWSQAYITEIDLEGVVCHYYWYGSYGATDEETLTVPWEWFTNRELVVNEFNAEHQTRLDADIKKRQEELQREKTNLEARLASLNKELS